MSSSHSTSPDLLLCSLSGEQLYKAYGLALRCLLSPIEYDSEVVSQLHKDSFARLRSVCGEIPEEVHRNVLAEGYTKCKVIDHNYSPPPPPP